MLRATVRHDIRNRNEDVEKDVFIVNTRAQLPRS
jgi:hypothetical protein